jgi:hypothetical protein
MKDYKKKFHEACADQIREAKNKEQITIAVIFILMIASIIGVMILVTNEISKTDVIGIIVCCAILIGLFDGLMKHKFKKFYVKQLQNAARDFTSEYALDIINALRGSYFPTISQEFIDQLNRLMSQEDWLDPDTFEFETAGMVFDYQHDKDAVLLLEFNGWYYYLTGWTYGAHLDGFIFHFDKRPIGGNGPIDQVTYYIHRAE